jgi:hypothetical protein
MASAKSRPIPPPAPVTTTALSFNSMSSRQSRKPG